MRFNFSDEVRSALSRARDESLRLRHGRVATEHILLGILGDRKIDRLIRDFGSDPASLRTAVEKQAPPGDSTQTKGEVPYTSSAKRALEFAMAAARELRDDVVFPGHLLIGLLRVETALAAEVLRDSGITEAVVIGSRTSRLKAAAFRVAIDDASDRSIYEQVVAQVTEAVATGALEPGDRLPTVRRLADDLDIAPGTVAKAYGELERQGLVVTEGARGTRVAERSHPASRQEKTAALTGLLRPVAVAAFHMGANASELRKSLEEAMVGILEAPGGKRG